MNLNSRSEWQAGHLVIRASDCRANLRSTGLSMVFPVAPDAKPAAVLTAAAACCHYLDAEREPNAEREPSAEQEPMTVEAGC
jgi:hypothetical protein